MALEIKNLSKTYNKEKKALSDISLTIGKGMFGLLGQNGAGKSTLMRTIATLQNPDSGGIFLDGINVLKEPEEMRKILGYLPQDFGVYENVTAFEMLHHIAKMKGVANKLQRNETIEELLHRVNLHDVKDRKLSHYSGGMRQRFGIAQALLGDPKIIIVDEPTAGLDPMERNRFYNLLSDIGENTIVILSTHIVEDVSTLCNDMAIIGHGKVLKAGKPNEIEQELSGKLWTKKLEKAELKKVQEKHQVISTYYEAGKPVLTVLAEQQPDPSFSSKRPTLEDAYFNLMFQQNIK
ncbi:multidrug ABC transporter ATPase [Sphingobacterium sp. ML3W]|uniref:ABC transporter ATP-binding protein n=1 Tax=Sphingobacterium sp. ML3W TaxID=1538644 RepID=UPI0004F7F5F9|nr:ABC transporter ATP-binding protein [Sphingobacterium sp. ML3W]AIM35240.1 multidrug ABC transporter ATPase [Sphingobacterium sp. ML3W]